MKQERGECERCLADDKLLILSLEGMVCYQCAEEIDFEDEDEEEKKSTDKRLINSRRIIRYENKSKGE